MNYRLRTKKGFTMLEAILVVAVIAVILAAISPLFRTVVEGREKQDRQIELMQIGRVGMDDMVRNIKTATAFVTADASTLEFEDWEGTNIEYDLNGDTLEKDGDSLAEPIDSLTFTYYDSDGDITVDPLEVRSVEISMTVSDAEGKTDPVTFTSIVAMRKDAASPSMVAINEINYNAPQGGVNEKKNEWIEIYNFGDDA
ncbi:MAG: type II secretion system GspH family protein, partial [Candidatus Omnitrophica bacterium]|nr:type II secretion system GspH family protein [Candidatus Omnitrophota bacterium]